MVFHKQTRLHTGDGPKERGNCLPACFACLLDLESPEDCIQVQEFYDLDNLNNTIWIDKLQFWLKERGLRWVSTDGHLYDGSLYLVSGMANRGFNHICIYRDGKLYHDPHPSGEGLINERDFSRIESTE